MDLNQIEILTNDLKATKDFYENVLELVTKEIEPKSLTIEIGLSTLKFYESFERPRPIYHLAFNIPENKLNEAIDWCENRIDLIRKEDAVLIAEFESWNARAIYFYDNNGNILEFIARHGIEHSETEKFGSKQILNISEIGIVKKKPLEFGDRLIEKFGLNWFEKNHNSERFAAIGDDNGLLIIVEPDRNWYPTIIPAKNNWTKIELTNDGETNNIELVE